MDRASEPVSTAASMAPAPARHEGRPEIDLDRLVWDPEYREAMRPWLRHAD